jgi:hypothetical protein
VLANAYSTCAARTLKSSDVTPVTPPVAPGAPAGGVAQDENSSATARQRRIAIVAFMIKRVAGSSIIGLLSMVGGLMPAYY